VTSPGLIPPAGLPVYAKVLIVVGVLAAVSVFSALAYAKWGVAGLVPGGAVAAEGIRRLKASAAGRRRVEAARISSEQAAADARADAAASEARTEAFWRAEAARIDAAASAEPVAGVEGLSDAEKAREARLREKWGR